MIDFQNHISSLLNENNLTIDEIENIKLSENEENEVYYKAIDYASKFIKDIFVPFLEHPINPSEKERVVNHIFLKIYYLILSILKLNELRDFLAPQGLRPLRQRIYNLIWSKEK